MQQFITSFMSNLDHLYCLVSVVCIKLILPLLFLLHFSENILFTCLLKFFKCKVFWQSIVKAVNSMLERNEVPCLISSQKYVPTCYIW